MVAERQEFGWKVHIERLGSNYVPPIIRLSGRQEWMGWPPTYYPYPHTAKEDTNTRALECKIKIQILKISHVKKVETEKSIHISKIRKRKTS